jgi:heme/copper-type cytochrome/quinol oxidase subunit 2
MLQQIFNIILTVLFTAVLVEGFIVLTLFLYRTVKDFSKPKKPVDGQTG